MDIWTCIRDFCAILEAKRLESSEKQVWSHKVLKQLLDLTQSISAISDDFSTGANDSIHEQTILRLVDDLQHFAAVPEYHGREDIGYSKSDFDGVSTRAETVFSFFISLNLGLENAIKERPQRKRQFLQEITKHILLLGGEHMRRKHWTSELSQGRAKELLDSILNLTSCKGLTALLCDPPKESSFAKGMAGVVLECLKPHLQKGVWKTHPGKMAVFVWLIQEVHFPYMGPLLLVVLPPCLLLTDDHEADNKAAGISCLHHLLRETTREELRRYGRAEVIYDVIQQALYSCEVPVIATALPAIVATLAVVETPPVKMAPPRIETRYDTILERLLQSMELESQLITRRLYTQNMPAMLSAMGLTLCRHLARILSVIDSYLQQADGPSEEARLGALHMLSIVIKEAWPRIPHHTDCILQTIFRLVHDLSDDQYPKSEPHQMLMAEVSNCASLLYAADEKRVHEQLSGIIEAKVRSDCRKFAHNILSQKS